MFYPLAASGCPKRGSRASIFFSFPEHISLRLHFTLRTRDLLQKTESGISKS